MGIPMSISTNRFPKSLILSKAWGKVSRIQIKTKPQWTYSMPYECHFSKPFCCTSGWTVTGGGSPKFLRQFSFFFYPKIHQIHQDGWGWLSKNHKKSKETWNLSNKKRPLWLLTGYKLGMKNYQQSCGDYNKPIYYKYVFIIIVYPLTHHTFWKGVKSSSSSKYCVFFSGGYVMLYFPTGNFRLILRILPSKNHIPNAPCSGRCFQHRS